MLEGLPAIATFLGKSVQTVRRWILHDGLPCSKLPNGKWFTHKGLILQWIYAGHEAIVKNRVGYALEPEELATLAEKMGVDPNEVYKRMEHDAGVERSKDQTATV
tara:strand:+ start:115 stop:429 length:315 start_codon:yes stop_codon:yes gene_type:complete